MIPLPLCRWRKPHLAGQYLCQSPKFPHPPNVVSRSFCAECRFVNHEVPPPLPQALPCVHLGASLGTENGSPDFFACAVHGRCTLSETEPRGFGGDRSCNNCSDYLPRNPFGKTSEQMLKRAERFLATIPKYPMGHYRGRGIVIAAGGDHFFPSLYVTVRALRHVGCTLPIQVWYLGRKNEMPPRRRKLLAPYQVQCVDADRVRRRHPARRLSGWELKVFATLHCPFEELLFLDADCYPCRNPEFLFEREDYRARGAIFWPDSFHIDTRLKWPAYGVPDPRRLSSIESGQFLLNKAQCWQPLNLAWFYNNHSDYYYRYCHGDKHTLEVAWHRCARPYVMWAARTPWAEDSYLQLGPDDRPLFVHRCRDKFRFGTHKYTTPQTYPTAMFHALLPLERECWTWMAELARLTGNTLGRDKTTHLLQPSPRRKASRPQFAIGMAYTPEIADMGRRTAAVMTAYASRHGYGAVVTTTPIDPCRHPVWSKLLLVHRYLWENPQCSWLLWLDADAVIMNPGQRLEKVVDDGVDFIAAATSVPGLIDAAVFLVRNCPATLDLLRRAYAKTHHQNTPAPVQRALSEALRESAETVRARLVSRRLLSSLAAEYQPGDFILHLGGLSAELKLQEIKKATALAKQHSLRQAKTLL